MTLKEIYDKFGASKKCLDAINVFRLERLDKLSQPQTPAFQRHQLNLEVQASARLYEDVKQQLSPRSRSMQQDIPQDEDLRARRGEDLITMARRAGYRDDSAVMVALNRIAQLSSPVTITPLTDDAP
jgi:hypothetical protein